MKGSGTIHMIVFSHSRGLLPLSTYHSYLHCLICRRPHFRCCGILLIGVVLDFLVSGCGSCCSIMNCTTNPHSVWCDLWSSLHASVSPESQNVYDGIHTESLSGWFCRGSWDDESSCISSHLCLFIGVLAAVLKIILRLVIFTHQMNKTFLFHSNCL